ncbi:hypothetical protein [Burkholderia pyrrocinia]|uniref:hypothetical protein n=1 Tax=Burkholderia pyrrocinia TaxID=60550 RepID=UPI0030D2BAE3
MDRIDRRGHIRAGSVRFSPSSGSPRPFPKLEMARRNQAGQVYLVWKDVKVLMIAACGVGQVAEERKQECFAKHLPMQGSYSRLVSEVQAMVDEIVR